MGDGLSQRSGGSIAELLGHLFLGPGRVFELVNREKKPAPREGGGGRSEACSSEPILYGASMEAVRSGNTLDRERAPDVFETVAKEGQDRGRNLILQSSEDGVNGRTVPRFHSYLLRPTTSEISVSPYSVNDSAWQSTATSRTDTRMFPRFPTLLRKPSASLRVWRST
jgi:hypothetical protein